MFQTTTIIIHLLNFIDDQLGYFREWIIGLGGSHICGRVRERWDWCGCQPFHHGAWEPRKILDFSRANRLKPWGFLPWNIVESGVPSQFRSQNSIRFWLSKEKLKISIFISSIFEQPIWEFCRRKTSRYDIEYHIISMCIMYIYIYIYTEHSSGL